MQGRNLPGGPRRYLEKVQESSPVLVQARNLPGGPRRYLEKVQESSPVYWCRPGTFQVDLEGTIEKVQESSPVLLMQARNLPGGPRRYYRKSAGKFTCTGAGQGPSRWT